MVSKKTMLVMVITLLTAFIGGCASNPLPPQAAPNQLAQSEQPPAAAPGNHNDSFSSIGQEKMIITVYNSTKDGLYLAAEQHVVSTNDHPAQTAIELLLAGTKNVDLVSVVPIGTKLRHIGVKDKIAYVDFNDKIVKNNTGGSAGEILLVGAIVNTLTEFHNIQKVQIMVDGKKIETISGHMDIGEPLGRFEKIIKK